jgi:hypothetical protein
VNLADAAGADLPQHLEDFQFAFARRQFGQGTPPGPAAALRLA